MGQQVKWRRGPAILIILLCLLAASWFVLDQVGPSNPLRDLASGVIAPLQYFASTLFPSPGQVSGALESDESLRHQLQQAADEIARLRTQVILLQEAEIENSVLREQLDFKSASPNYALLSAQVIGRDPVGELDYMIIDRGAQDGLKMGMPVVTPEGLAGRIARVARSSSLVMLITDPTSSVTGLVQRSRASGLIVGAPGHHLVMRYIPQTDVVEEGDIVLTSGLGAAFPRGLVIGQIVALAHQDIDMFQTAELVPAVDLTNLESVLIITNFDDQALQEVETEAESAE